MRTVHQFWNIITNIVYDIAASAPEDVLEKLIFQLCLDHFVFPDVQTRLTKFFPPLKMVWTTVQKSTLTTTIVVVCNVMCFATH